MGALQRRINLFHYNIWRFERWTRYLVFGDPQITTLNSADSSDLKDTMPFAAGSVDESMLPNYSGGHFGILLLLVLLSILNLVSFVVRSGYSFWFWGMIVCVIAAILASHYLTPIPMKIPPEREGLLDDFKTFESMSESEKQRSGIVTFCIVIVVWAVFVLSFVFYLRSSVV